MSTEDTDTAVAEALSRAATANGHRLRELRYPLARAALTAARPLHYNEAAASLRDLAGHSADAGASDEYIDGINHAVAWLDSKANDLKDTE